MLRLFGQCHDEIFFKSIILQCDVWCTCLQFQFLCQRSCSPGSLRKLIKKFSPTKKFEAIEALIEAAIRDLPEGQGSDFVYSSFFAENRNGDQGEVRGLLFDEHKASKYESNASRF